MLQFKLLPLLRYAHLFRVNYLGSVFLITHQRPHSNVLTNYAFKSTSACSDSLAGREMKFKIET